MEVKIKEWGNSQGIRFPKTVLQEAGITVNVMPPEESGRTATEKDHSKLSGG